MFNIVIFFTYFLTPHALAVALPLLVNYVRPYLCCGRPHLFCYKRSLLTISSKKANIRNINNYEHVEIGKQSSLKQKWE